MKKHKKILGALLCITLLINIFGSSVYAVETSAASVTPRILESEAAKIKSSLENVPIYIEFAEESNKQQPTSNSPISSQAPTELSIEERELLWKNEMFLATLKKAQSMIDAGCTVRGIHFQIPLSKTNDFSPSTSTFASGSWKDYTFALGSYNGFEFRYLDSYVDGETGYIDVKDIGKVNWADLVKTGLIAVVPGFLGPVGTAFEVLVTFGDLLDAASVKPNVTYSYDAQNYVRYNALYRHHMRQFYMSDKDDRVYGLDYYLPGTAERVEVDNHMLYRCPLNNGSWESGSGKTGSSVIQTPGYKGNSTIYAKFVQSYNSSNDKKYYENIDLKASLIDIMLNV